MAPLEQDVFAAGDVVEVINMPESGINGLVGTLKKTVGKGRWALNLEGDDRSRVVNVENLRKRAMKADARRGLGPSTYCIVGTWDDWERNEMTWNGDLESFEYLVTIGEQGSENFKFLLNGDWDQCVYPDQQDANPFVPHLLKGPDDGSKDEEWTIGFHPKDQVAKGSLCRIRLSVAPDRSPKGVFWEVVKPEVKLPGKSHVKPVGADAKSDAKSVAAAKKRGVSWEMGSFCKPDVSPEPQVDPHKPFPVQRGGGGQRVMDSTQPWQEEEVVERERKARERLARRLEAANELLAIQDDAGDLAMLQETAKRETEQRGQQVVENRERYRKDTEEDEHITAVLDFVQRPAPLPGRCMECQQPCNNLVNSQPCCDDCWEQWEDLRRKGWNPMVLCDGVPAAVHVEELVAAGRLSRAKARQYVMRLYQARF